jgi:hypothetical protein
VDAVVEEKAKEKVMKGEEAEEDDEGVWGQVEEEAEDNV